MIFDGRTYQPQFDEKRLKGQMQRVYTVLSDGKYRTLEEIANEASVPLSTVGSRVRDLRKERFGAFTVEMRARGDRPHGLFEYALKAPSFTPRFEANGQSIFI